MENFPNFEQRESVIDELVRNLAEKEGMNPDDVMSDIVTFAPYEGNEASNPDYIDQVAEMLGIASEEMRLYAIKKAREYLEG
ncbi:MAG: hypothetical protein Q8R26_02860 [bacterium]|nr:hypothetical protein [bacterium]